MSAIANYWDDPCVCWNCGSDDITPHITFGVEVDEHGRYLSVDGYKCYDCGERWKACSKMNTYAVETDAGIRTWCADDEAHAIEQHKDDFGDDETIIRVWEITNESLGLESKHG